MRFVINPGDMAGFDLAGYVYPDGSVKLLGTPTRVIEDWPKEVELFNRTYTLEDVTLFEKDKDGRQFANAIYV